jgi:hypothetical protein
MLIGRKRCGLIWSRGEFAVKVRMNTESNFEMSQEDKVIIQMNRLAGFIIRVLEGGPLSTGMFDRF